MSEQGLDASLRSVDASSPLLNERNDSPIRLRPLLSEFIGTFFIEFLAAACTVVSANSGLVSGALGIGFSFTVIMFMTRAASGAHMNPAVTLGVMATSPSLGYFFNNIQGLGYIFCQLLGSFSGAAVCSSIIPLTVEIVDAPATEDTPAVHHKGSVMFISRGVLSVDHGLSVFLFEFFCTFAIVWVYFATMIDHRSRRRSGGFGPLAVGLGIAVGVLAEGPGTGGTRRMRPCCMLPSLPGHACGMNIAGRFPHGALAFVAVLTWSVVLRSEKRLNDRVLTALVSLSCEPQRA
jgi:glycerol uptake facilitator-like aquaporin